MSEETNDPSRKTENQPPASGAASAAATTDEAVASVGATASGPESAATSAPAGVTPAKKSGGGLGLAIGVLVVLLLGGGAYLTRDRWMPLIGPMIGEGGGGGMTATSSATSGGPAEPAAEAVSLEDAVAMEQQLAQQLDTLGGRVSAIEESIGQLRQAIDTLASQTNTKELAATVSVVADRVTRMERTSADIAQLQREFGELNSKAVALREGFSALNATVLAVNQLAQAVDDGVPYARPLAAAKSVVSDDADMAAILASLESNAETGIPTFAALRAQFPSVADAVARASNTSGGGEWYERALDKVVSLVTIRVTGDAAARAGGIDAILAEAEGALKGGDLAATVAVVDRLEGPAAAAAADWLQAAQLRLAATQAVSRLQEQAAMRLAQARG